MNFFVTANIVNVAADGKFQSPGPYAIAQVFCQAHF